MLVLLSLSLPVQAGTLRYDVSANSRQVVVGQPFRISCEVEAKGGSIEDLQLPDLGELIQLGESRSQGSQISVVNGQMTMSRTLTVTLTVQADHAATFHIGAGSVRSDGQTAKSRPFDIVANGSNAKPPAAQSAPSGAANNWGSSPSSPGSANSAQSQAAKNSDLFVALELDRDSAWLGQQIIAQLVVYSRRQLSDVSAMQLPDFSGLVVEDLQSPRRISGRSVTISGRRFQRYMLRRMALFPTQAGTLHIPPAGITVVVGGGFFNQGRSYKLRSEALQVEVKALPAQGQPAGFNPGNVGAYALEVGVDSQKISVDKAVTLRVAVNGRGNLRAVVLPKLESLDNARLYPPNPSEDINSTPQGIQGRKAYEVLLQAQHPGRLHIPVLKFYFFDPEHGEYQLARSQAFDIEVTAGSQLANTVVVDNTQQPSAMTARARPVRIHPDCQTLPKPWSRMQMILLTVVASGLFVFIWALVIILQRRRGSIRHKKIKQRQQAREQLRQLSKAQPVDVDALALAVDAYLELCLHSAIIGLTREQLDAHLAEHGFTDEQRQQVLAFYAWAEARRFAPGQGQSSTQIAELVEQLLQAIDKALPIEAREKA